MRAFLVVRNGSVPVGEALYLSRWEAELCKQRYNRRGLDRARVLECKLVLPYDAHREEDRDAG